MTTLAPDATTGRQSTPDRHDDPPADHDHDAPLARPRRRVRPTPSTTASGPVEITFWHGLNDELETALVALTDAYNASQDKVHVDLQNQTGYDAAIDKYIQSSHRQPSRPGPVPRVLAAGVRRTPTR